MALTEIAGLMAVRKLWNKGQIPNSQRPNGQRPKGPIKLEGTKKLSLENHIGPGFKIGQNLSQI